MSSEEAPPPSLAMAADDPHQVYTERKSERQAQVAALAGQLDRIGLARLLVFGLGLVLAWLIFASRILSFWWLAVPLLAFLVLLSWTQRVRRSWRRAQRAERFYDYCLERVEERWHGRGHSGQRYLDEKHLYALDLDIFGPGSVFERLCLARTRRGEDTLAHWLREPASPEEIRARQQAVQDLRSRLDLREDLALLGTEVPPVDFAPLAAWGQLPRQLPSGAIRWAVAGLALMNALLAIAWLVFGITSLYLAISLTISAVVVLPLARRVHAVLEPMQAMGRDLLLLSGVLGRLERETFTAPRLCELQAQLQVDGQPPSWQIGRLAMLVDWLNAMKNQLFLPLGLLLLWRTQIALALEAWRSRSGPAIAHWLTVLGEMEALSSLAGYAFENPDDVFPEIVTGPPCLSGEQLGHPLLPKKRCVRNDVCLGNAVQLLLVSGSNMSGKSTLLRTVGVNTVLALAGAPVRAKQLRLTPLAVVATLRVQDSLLEGRSRFFAEISRIRDLLERSQQELPVLFLLDELFHGTNSHDRSIGAEALLHRLLANGALGLVTTHDLSLTQITERLGAQVRNVHFADQFVNGEMHFDYTMRPGVVPHSNALVLMRAVGLEV